MNICHEILFFKQSQNILREKSEIFRGLVPSQRSHLPLNQ